MTTLVIKNEESKLTPFYIKNDAARLDTVNNVLFTSAQKEFGNLLYSKVCEVFHRSQVFKNYRKKFIAVKVAKPTKADLASLGVVKLESYCKTNNIQMVTTGNGIVFRILK
jgi:hypothetical protein